MDQPAFRHFEAGGGDIPFRVVVESDAGIQYVPAGALEYLSPQRPVAAIVEWQIQKVTQPGDSLVGAML